MHIAILRGRMAAAALLGLGGGLAPAAVVADPAPGQEPASSAQTPQQPAAAAAATSLPAPPVVNPTPATLVETTSPATAAPQFGFTDSRPDKERKTRSYLTLWRFSCSFGVQDIGDEMDDRVGKLRHDLIADFGDRLAGKTIVVSHYHLYLNQRTMEGQHNLATAAFGLLALGAGADAKTSKPACSHDKMPEGWFDPSELTTPWSPFIAELDITVDGQAHHVHSVYSPPKNMPAPGVLGDFDKKAEAEAVHAAVDKANVATVAELSGQLGSGVGAPAPAPVRPPAPGPTPAAATAPPADPTPAAPTASSGAASPS